MPRPYSIDLRDRIVKAYEGGEGSQEEIAEKYNISLRTFTRYWKQYQETWDITAILERSGRPSRIDAIGLEKIRLIVEKKPDITLAEIGKEYNGRSSRPVGRTVIWSALVKLGFKRKKKSLYCTQQERSDIKKWAAGIYKMGCKARYKSTYFFDESGAHLGFSREYARIIGGGRIKCAVPYPRGHAYSMLSAIGIKGVTASLYGEWSVNGEVFLIYSYW